MRHPGSTEPGSAVGGVGKVSRTGAFAGALGRAAALVLPVSPRAAVSLAGESAGAAAAVSAGLRDESAAGRSARGVTASVQEAGIVAQRSGTMGGRSGTVSARVVFAAASFAPPERSQASNAGTPNVATITANRIDAVILSLPGVPQVSPSGVQRRAGTI